MDVNEREYTRIPFPFSCIPLYSGTMRGSSIHDFYFTRWTP